MSADLRCTSASSIGCVNMFLEPLDLSLALTLSLLCGRALLLQHICLLSLEPVYLGCCLVSNCLSASLCSALSLSISAEH